jgi:hypothetical protein
MDTRHWDEKEYNAILKVGDCLIVCAELQEAYDYCGKDLAYRMFITGQKLYVNIEVDRRPPYSLHLNYGEHMQAWGRPEWADDSENWAWGVACEWADTFIHQIFPNLQIVASSSELADIFDVSPLLNSSKLCQNLLLDEFQQLTHNRRLSYCRMVECALLQPVGQDMLDVGFRAATKIYAAAATESDWGKAFTLEQRLALVECDFCAAEIAVCATTFTVGKYDPPPAFTYLIQQLPIVMPGFRAKGDPSFKII